MSETDRPLPLADFPDVSWDGQAPGYRCFRGNRVGRAAGWGPGGRVRREDVFLEPSLGKWCQRRVTGLGP